MLEGTPPLQGCTSNSNAKNLMLSATDHKRTCLSIAVQKDSWTSFTAGQAPCGAGNLDVSSTSTACRWGWGCDGAPHSCRHLHGIAPPWQRQFTCGSGQRGQTPLLQEGRKPQIKDNSSKLQEENGQGKKKKIESCCSH